MQEKPGRKPKPSLRRYDPDQVQRVCSQPCPCADRAPPRSANANATQRSAFPVLKNPSPVALPIGKPRQRHLDVELLHLFRRKLGQTRYQR